MNARQSVELIFARGQERLRQVLDCGDEVCAIAAFALDGRGSGPQSKGAEDSTKAKAVTSFHSVTAIQDVPLAPQVFLRTGGSEILTLWKSSEPVQQRNDLPHPSPLPLGEGESMSALEKTYALGLGSDWLESSLPAGEGWDEGEVHANSISLRNLAYGSEFLRLHITVHSL